MSPGRFVFIPIQILPSLWAERVLILTISIIYFGKFQPSSVPGPEFQPAPAQAPAAETMPAPGTAPLSPSYSDGGVGTSIQLAHRGLDVQTSPKLRSPGGMSDESDTF